MLLLTHCGHLCQLHEDVKWLLLQFHQALVQSFVGRLCTVNIYSERSESSQWELTRIYLGLRFCTLISHIFWCCQAWHYSGIQEAECWSCLVSWNTWWEMLHDQFSWVSMWKKNPLSGPVQLFLTISVSTLAHLTLKIQANCEETKLFWWCEERCIVRLFSLRLKNSFCFFA